jgi:hypothetical protein
MTMLSARNDVTLFASVTVTVNPTLPLFAVVGVPEMTPSDDKVRPVGNDPAVNDHVFGKVPPVETSVWLYARLTSLAGRLDVVTARLAGNTSEFDTAGVLPPTMLFATTWNV